MKALFIGGTGIISTQISRLLVSLGWNLTLLNRGNRSYTVPGANQMIADINDEAEVSRLIENEHYDVVADFICFTPEQAQRDIRLFKGKTDQFIFISSASAYQKPLSSPVITESTPLSNPYWQYSRNKIAIEEMLMKEYRENGFPITIVRPSHTYSRRSLPLSIHGNKGEWQVLKRMLEGKKVLVPGDGTSLWAVMSSRDFAPAFVGLMGNIHAIGQAVQITSEEMLTWNQIMATVAHALGVEYKPCFVPSTLISACSKYDFVGALIGDKANSVIFDNSKIHSLVPTYTQSLRFDQAAQDSVQYFLSHPEKQVEDPEFDHFCDQVVAIMEDAEKKVAAL